MPLPTFDEVMKDKQDVISRIEYENLESAVMLTDPVHENKSREVIYALNSSYSDMVLFAFLNADPEAIAEKAFEFSDIVAVMEPHQRVKYVSGLSSTSHREIFYAAARHSSGAVSADELAKFLHISVPEGRPQEHPAAPAIKAKRALAKAPAGEAGFVEVFGK